jgi:hypothetical protein
MRDLRLFWGVVFVALPPLNLSLVVSAYIWLHDSPAALAAALALVLVAEAALMARWLRARGVRACWRVALATAIAVVEPAVILGVVTSVSLYAVCHSGGCFS